MKNRIKILYGIIIFLFIILVGVLIYKKSPSASVATNPSSKPIATTELSNQYKFDVPGQTIDNSPLIYRIISAQKVPVISIEDKLVPIPETHVFLVLSIELQNDSTKPYIVQTYDFIRMVDENDKKFAPDFYNQDVTVAPQSIQRDEIAFVVPEDQREFRFFVGEIEGEKEELTITL